MAAAVFGKKALPALVSVVGDTEDELKAYLEDPSVTLDMAATKLGINEGADAQLKRHLGVPSGVCRCYLAG